MRAVLLLVLLGSTALAHPPPQLAEPAPTRPRLEWSTWMRVSYEATLHADAAAARTLLPPPPAPIGSGWSASAGAEITVPVVDSGDVRIGPWVELRGFTSPVAGGELQVGGAPHALDLFFYRGEGILTLRAGGNRELVTGAIAWGYRAPWKLWGPWEGTSRYMIGVRFVLTAARAVENPRDWSLGLGLEVEPIGALRYLLGIRSLY